MSLDPLVLKYQTKDQFVARLRADYAQSVGDYTTKLATCILGWIADGSLTDAQVRAAFGQTVAQWAQFKQATLTPQANARAADRGAKGS